MQRQFAGLAELAVADREHAVDGVEVIAIEADRLSDAHSGRRQQANQCPIGCLSVGPAQDRGRRHQGGDFVVRVEVRRRSACSTWQDIRRRHLGGRVDPAQVGGEATNIGEPPGSPAPSAPAGAVAQASAVSVVRCLRHDLRRRRGTEREASRSSKLVTKGATHGQIIGEGLAEGVHADVSRPGAGDHPQGVAVDLGVNRCRQSTTVTQELTDFRQ